MMDKKEEMHPEDKRNLIIFIVAALLVWYGFDTFLLQPRLEAMKQAQQVTAERAIDSKTGEAAPRNLTADMAVSDGREREELLADAPRLLIDNPEVKGSIVLQGGYIDDLALKNYFETLEKEENVVLLSPKGTKAPRFVDLGWMPAEGLEVSLPKSDTRWRVEGNDRLTHETPVTLVWENNQGLRFEREFSIDENYMFTVTQRVLNSSGKTVTLFPYALVSQQGLGHVGGSRVGMEGLVGYLDGELEERAFRKMAKDPRQTFQADEGWLGISQQYWFTSIVPTQQGEKTFRFLHTKGANKRDPGRFQVDYVGGGTRIAPGETAEAVTHVFAGAKRLELLEHYEEIHGIRHFDLAVDFGLWYFMTKPLFHLLNFLGDLTGNFGIGIIIVTILMRLAVFPLANTSYRSFAKMKQISPKMKELREKFGDDKTKLQKELVALYEREKVNPMAGCFPILIQIPIFFALFKVLSISIEMRHAPFYGWINDLSVRDPTSIFNLFGLIPWQPPEFMMIGVWPCIMLLAMLAQRRMNPPPQDPIQAGMADFMPFVMTYILSQFAAGLVIYWTFSNILSVVQQYVIMRSMGVEVHLFRRDKEDKEMEEMVRKGPNIHPELEVMEDDVEEALFGHKDEDGEGPETEPPKSISPPKRKRKKKKK